MAQFELRKPNAGTRHRWQRITLNSDVCLRCNVKRVWSMEGKKLRMLFDGVFSETTPSCLSMKKAA
jgi:hypothetical protein